MQKIKVFLVDDAYTLMGCVEKILNRVEVVGNVTLMAANQKTIQLKAPDVVIVNFSSNEKEGAELLGMITREFPALKVIVLSVQDDFNSISAKLKAGIKGYLLADVKHTELHKAINKVMHGETYIQSSVANKFINGYQKENHVIAINNLSPREVEIIRLIAKEHTSADIGKMLFISEHTVETHRKNIWRKTGVKSIVGLLNFAHEHQLI
ncbi:response regulator transcription factor [Pedobacter sp. HDW13]|uniref:LuxR C-terminal-related transcriptional regulator n=1 Tax=Pedobacter sp. HDW13 TaxID=2714940 RepID=UPI00140BAC64|nr:response regulator transcription factor [Pedobacter sp. HDW13]QIL40072.1 response regulator transcription factor [Pedobacter sp. HDW13]